KHPRIHGNPRKDCRTRDVHRVAPRVRTRRTVTVSEGRHRHRPAPVSRSSAADRNPACRASASVMSERKARLASSMNRRPNAATVTWEVKNRSQELATNVRRRVSIGSPDRPRDLEPPVLEEEGVVVTVLVHAPHLYVLHATLERGLGDGLEPKVDDLVREELF